MTKFNMNEFLVEAYNKAEKEAHIVWGNCIVYSVKLKNGFVIVEHCICRNPEQFDIEKGIELCKEKVMQRLKDIYEVVTVKNPDSIKKFSMKAQ